MEPPNPSPCPAPTAMAGLPRQSRFLMRPQLLTRGETSPSEGGVPHGTFGPLIISGQRGQPF
jgi:hypothetical protein